MSKRRDSPDPRETDAETSERALRALARLLGRQAAREGFVQGRSRPDALTRLPSWPTGQN
jgi:hypothetical protein